MNTNKPILVAGLIAALSVGAVSVAEASSGKTHFVSSSKTVHFAASVKPTIAQVDPDVAVLAKLVAAGTITQAQSDAVLAALQAARPVKTDNDNDGVKNGQGTLKMSLDSDIAVITSTLGITTAQLQTDLVAGQSLATIAGTKTAALITALVAAETTKINASVTAGTITQAQATTLIAGLTAAVTAAVNVSFGHEMPGMGSRLHIGAGAPSVSPSTSGDSD